ncbi:hypothetical protein M3Y94_00535700 [Aphelenchoides besseyi]|nr:hypothetical protein M3Y94_00535700 [Aphelenchoides besseyi]KAI6225815.1 hypothetical protein M3Y95_00736900 [Aphelenchoides besseyi]
MSSKTTRRKRDEGSGIGARASKRSKRDFFEHTTYCSELFNAIRSARGQDGRLISESLQRAPSRRQDPDYHNAIERAMDLSRINQKRNADEYNSLDEMCADIELLIENTISFYKPESVEYQHAVELKRVYEVEKEKLLQGSSRSESRTDRMSIASTGTTGSVKREPSPKPEEWRMEALLCAILDEHDSQGRLLCPPFRVLASPESFPMYYEHIQQPMDLKTVATKLRNADYATWTNFGDDLKLMYKNAKSFNETSSTIYKDAVNLHNRTVKRLQEFSSIKKPSASELNKNKQTVDNLLTQEFVSEGEEESEDSDEEAVQKADTPFAHLTPIIGGQPSTAATQTKPSTKKSARTQPPPDPPRSAFVLWLNAMNLQARPGENPIKLVRRWEREFAGGDVSFWKEKENEEMERYMKALP